MTNTDNFPRHDYGESDLQPFTLHPEPPCIELTCGARVCIRSVYQFGTYGGQLCGLPMDIGHHVERAVSAAKGLFSYLGEPVVLPAVVAVGRRPTMMGKQTENSEPFPWPWEMLPPVTTCAVLSEKSRHNAMLLVWFQDGLGYPPAEIVEQIRALDWPAHTVEVDI